MHCTICDIDDDTVSVFPNDLCPRCQAIIQDALEEFEMESETEDDTELDYAEDGREDSLHGSGVEPISLARRPFCETYQLPAGA